MNFMSQDEYNKESFIIYFALKNVKRKKYESEQYLEKMKLLKQKRKLLKFLKLI
jgi:hypothetical protein